MFTFVLVSVIITSGQAQAPKKTPKVITLNGCVERDDNDPQRYTITDTKAGTKYWVTGKDFREFLGRPVQLDGGIVVKGMKISGGLQPNPNIAAQAGALDPSRAAVQAATSGQSVGPEIDVQEFRVKAIRPAGGGCK
jgi:hypothetical protein